MIKCSVKKRLQHRCFPVNIAKFLRIPIVKNNCQWLLPYEDAKIASGYVHVSAEFIWTGLYLNIYRLQSGYFLAKKEFCITHSIFRSSRLQMFFEIAVHENFANFTGKHLSRSLFLIKLQRLWHRCFPEKFAKFLQHLFYRTTPVTASEF